MVSTVFAAATLEAFINESADLADRPEDVFDKARDPDVVRTFGQSVKKAEARRETVAHKYLLASNVFTGSAYDRGRKPYQDFDLLMELRNALVHSRPQDRVHFTPDLSTYVPGYPRLVERLRSKKVVANNIPPDMIVSWMRLITTRAMARWSCNTAANTIQSVIAIIPESPFRETLAWAYRTIQPVE